MRRPWSQAPTSPPELSTVCTRLAAYARHVFPGFDLYHAEFEIGPHWQSTPDQPLVEIRLHSGEQHVAFTLTGQARRAAEAAGLLD